MEQPITVRMIDELGRVVLPVEVRHELGWSEKTSLEIYLNRETREVILKTYIDACIYCGATENLKEFNKRKICDECQKAISEL